MNKEWKMKKLILKKLILKDVSCFPLKLSVWPDNFKEKHSLVDLNIP